MQQEIDKVIGQHQSPISSHRLSLPYVTAFVMEVLRFRPAGPISPPNQVIHDTKLFGFDIPKGK